MAHHEETSTFLLDPCTYYGSDRSLTCESRTDIKSCSIFGHKCTSFCIWVPHDEITTVNTQVHLFPHTKRKVKIKFDRWSGKRLIHRCMSILRSDQTAVLSLNQSALHCVCVLCVCDCSDCCLWQVLGKASSSSTLPPAASTPYSCFLRDYKPRLIIPVLPSCEPHLWVPCFQAALSFEYKVCWRTPTSEYSTS